MRHRFNLFKDQSDLSAVSPGHVSLEEIDWFDWTPPSRSTTIFLYFKRLFWNINSTWRSSWPYISGDAFRNLADLAISSERDLDKFSEESLRDSTILFIRSDLFEKFLTQFKSFIRSSHILITGNSDKDFDTFPEVLAKKDVSWFTQNNLIKDDSRVQTIPIGIENLALGNYGRVKHLKVSRNFTHDKILFGPMGDTHPSRKTLLSSALPLQNIFYIPPKRLTSDQYVELSKNFKYVFCARGNGVDTHRFWESLYRGQTPIVLENAWSGSLEELGLPFISVPSIESLLDRISSFNFYKPDFNPTHVEALWMPFWKRMIQEEILKKWSHGVNRI